MAEHNTDQNTNKKQNKKPSKKRNYSFILSIALIAMMGYFIITVVQLRVDINQKQSQVETAEVTQQEAKVENEELKNTLNENSDSSYIEHVARDLLGYVLPGERVYYDISSGK